MEHNDIVHNSDNCYCIAPVARKPSESDNLQVENVDEEYRIAHIIPEAETANRYEIGTISFEDDIATFSEDFNGRIISKSFLAI